MSQAGRRLAAQSVPTLADQNHTLGLSGSHGGAGTSPVAEGMGIAVLWRGKPVFPRSQPATP